MSAHDWDLWGEQWRASRASPEELDALSAQTRRARRAIVMLRLRSTALAIAALAVVAAALRHASNAFEIALGLTVGIGIAGVWLADVVNQNDAREGAEAPANEYRRVRRALCKRQVRFVHLGWVIVALDLAFLIPWWIGGIAVHGRGFHLIQLLTIWGPLALMATFVAWTLVLRQRARAELRQLATSEPDESA